jgi:KDO2-lipid IV(A) lauroyltransferase
MRAIAALAGRALAHLWVALIRGTATWPVGLRGALAAFIGPLAWALVRRRRRIVSANLRACFPALSAGERRKLERRLFTRIARGVLDYGVLWSAPRETVEAFVRIEGLEHLAPREGQPLLMLAPHFVGLDAGGSRVAAITRTLSIYARQSNPVWSHWLHHGRSRFNKPVLVARGGGELRTALRAMREGLPFYYLPDMDNGAANSLFVPFLGVNAATLPMVSRLARTANARVVMAVTEQTAAGYVLHIGAPWDDFPGASVEEDTLRMNREIERWVLRMPDQYLWTHRRFKTRPAGEPPFY